MFREVRPFIILILLLIAMGSCKKDRRTLDTTVQPTTDLTASGNVQQLPVSMVTGNYGNIQVFNSKFKFLGTNNDPVFGRTQVGLYLDPHYSTADVDFTPPVTVDSAVFVFAVDPARFAGDLHAKLTYSVFRVDSVLSRKRVYTSGTENLHHPAPLGAAAERAYDDTARTVRVPLDPSFATAMLNDPLLSAAGTAGFDDKYRGFYIKASTAAGSEGVIMSCDLEAAKSGLFFYYKDSSDAPQTVMRFVFGGDNGVRFNTVQHDRSAAHPSLQSQLAGDSSASEHVFLQGLGGTRVRVDIPIKPETSDSFNLAISRAELVLNVDESFITNQYKVPPAISLLPIGAGGQDTLIQDQLTSTDNVRYGGQYLNGQYVFNIARHAQAIVNGEKANRGFYLVVSGPDRVSTLFRDEYFERAVIGGAANATLKPKFTLSYTRVSVK